MPSRVKGAEGPARSGQQDSASKQTPATAQDDDGTDLAPTGAREGVGDTDAPLCANCDEPIVAEPLGCSRCQEVQYCSASCREEDGDFHALRCVPSSGSAQASSARSSELREGSRVCVHGLTGFQAGLNGCEGELEAWMADIRKWFVRLDGGQIESVDAENLNPVHGECSS